MSNLGDSASAINVGDPVAYDVEEAVHSSAARRVIVVTVPSDTGVPNSSASACAVRLFDRNCPTYTYKTIAEIRRRTGSAPPQRPVRCRRW